MNYATIKGRIDILTGLRIGAGGASLEIGGADNPIVRAPLTREPYLPGSSLKGKLRSLLERDHYTDGVCKPASKPYRVSSNGREQEVKNHKEPCSCGECIVCWLFGCGKTDRAKGQTRLIFRDCKLSGNEAKQLADKLESVSFYTETKAEVQVPRTKGDANPRPNDRIPAGLSLDLEISVRVLDGDRPEIMKAALARAFSLLEKDALGGSGSRGYGQVKFEELEWDGQPWDFRAAPTQ